MLPRRLLSWLFALALLLGQAAAFAHTLSHLHPHDSALPDKVCEVCVTQAQLGSALPSGPLVLAVPAGDYIHTHFDAPRQVDASPRPACARAPPTAFHA